MASKRSHEVSVTSSRKSSLKKKKNLLAENSSKSRPLSVAIAKYAAKKEIEEVLPQLKSMRLDQLVARPWRLKDAAMCTQFLDIVEGRKVYEADHRVQAVEWRSAATIASAYDLPAKGVLPSSLDDAFVEEYFQGVDPSKKDGYFFQDCRNDTLRKLLRVLNPIFSPERWRQVQKKTVAAVAKAWVFPEYEIDWAGFLYGKFSKLAHSSDGKTYRCFLSPYLFHVYEKLGFLSWAERDYLKSAKEQYLKSAAAQIRSGGERRKAQLATTGTLAENAIMDHTKRMLQLGQSHDPVSLSSDSWDEDYDESVPEEIPIVAENLMEDTAVGNVSNGAAVGNLVKGITIGNGITSDVNGVGRNSLDLTIGGRVLVGASLGDAPRSVASKEIHHGFSAYLLPPPPPPPSVLRDHSESERARGGAAMDRSEFSYSENWQQPGQRRTETAGADVPTDFRPCIPLDISQLSTETERPKSLPHPSPALLSHLTRVAEQPTDLRSSLVPDELVGAESSRRTHDERGVFEKDLYAMIDGMVEIANQLPAKLTTWMEKERLKDSQIQSRAENSIQELRNLVTQMDAEISSLKAENTTLCEQVEHERNHRRQDEAQREVDRNNLKRQIGSLVATHIENFDKLLP